MKSSLTTKGSIARHHAAGFGTGTGADYKPWINVHHFSSSGKSTRASGWHTGRMQTFFSDPEYHFFLLLEWDDNVTDIREQFPLTPQEEINEICGILGIKIPRIPGAEAEMTRTTDFLVTTKSGEEAWAIKPAKKLEDLRILEKLDIERTYWERRGIPFGVSTEKEIDPTTVKNIQWIHKNRTFEGDEETLPTIRKYLEAELGDTALWEVCRDGDELLGLNTGDCLAAAKHFIATKTWKIDITKPLSTRTKLSLQ